MMNILTLTTTLITLAILLAGILIGTFELVIAMIVVLTSIAILRVLHGVINE